MIARMETGGARTMTQAAIEPLCANYNTECLKLEVLIAALEADHAAVRQRHLRALKRQAGLVAAPHLFLRPRTTILHGTEVGYTSSVGSVAFEDAERVVQLIARHLPDRFEELVKTEQTPRKDALLTLSGKNWPNWVAGLKGPATSWCSNAWRAAWKS